MLLALIAVIAGLALLVWSADQFIEGSIATARQLGLSPMLIGLTLVAFGTSAPEVLVSLVAALTGASHLAIGNALGSNIANMGLVLAATLLIAPIIVHSTTKRVELPVLIVATLLAWLLFLDQTLDFIDGLLLILGLIIAMSLMIRFGRASSAMVAEVEHVREAPATITVMRVTFGLILLIGSSRLLVWGATETALLLGVSELVIGLTVVAIGTSLPELASTVASALKGRHDMALGNIVGSNLFNLLLVLAIPPLIDSVPLNTEITLRDYGSMVLITLILGALIAHSRSGGRLGRGAGGILLLLYLAYAGLIAAGETGALSF